MARPLPIWPRGPRRRRPAVQRLLLACPRVSPQWELSAVRALIKPQTSDAIAHRHGEQPWPADAPATMAALQQQLQQRLDPTIQLHLPAQGAYHLAAMLPAQSEPLLDQARAAAVAASQVVPACWFVLGRLFVLDGRFYRRRFGYRLELVPATDVHLSRPLRQLVRELAAEHARGLPRPEPSAKARSVAKKVGGST